MENPQSSQRLLQDVTVPDADPMRPRALAWDKYSDMAMAEWYMLLSQEPEEDEVQRFLELHPAMIPGGSGDIGPGGHHGSDAGAVFRRPKLIGDGRTFEPDFMWVTRSSGLITPILIEIEKPSKRWFRKDGRPTSEFIEAHDQLNDWRSWFSRDGNQAIFRNTFLFLGDKYMNRPLEPQYVLIYGRESEFGFGGGHANPDGVRYKRDQQRARDESFMTFDALRPRYDHSNSMTLSMTAQGPEIYAFSPVYGTGTHTGDEALILGDPQAALSRSVMMSDERRAYLAKRWLHWQEHERQKKSDPNGVHIRRTGLE
ncbi:Shedu anti-phage system protein SduA domain-containing protein [Streptomyces mutabilis]|uniref:Shedu anti-phage system protein SduA domain-containing protein n=1 Tax=Streptomyces mutabilis TaxID=67332 RepID=UPI0011466223|nr:Shedu anti-phage system protein SduA domain-containing protein [Streptomyces mutabilis]